MTRQKKILISLPSVFNAIIYLLIIFPKQFFWLLPAMIEYGHLIGFGLILRGINYAIVTKALLSFKNISKTIKSKWAYIMLFFNPIASFILIWMKFDEFEKENF